LLPKTPKPRRLIKINGINGINLSRILWFRK